jgi:hypothetical protein
MILKDELGLHAKNPEQPNGLKGFKCYDVNLEPHTQHH